MKFHTLKSSCELRNRVPMTDFKFGIQLNVKRTNFDIMMTDPQRGRAIFIISPQIRDHSNIT